MHVRNPKLIIGKIEFRRSYPVITTYEVGIRRPIYLLIFCPATLWSGIYGRTTTQSVGSHNCLHCPQQYALTRVTHRKCRCDVNVSRVVKSRSRFADFVVGNNVGVAGKKRGDFARTFRDCPRQKVCCVTPNPAGHCKMKYSFRH